MRRYVLEHPGRYVAGDAARPAALDDPLVPAVDRVITSWTAMLRGYRLEPGQEMHALRMLRSVLHGFATLKAIGSFQMDADVDESFDWMLDLIDHALHADWPDPAR